jgi:hypothetical protein
MFPERTANTDDFSWDRDPSQSPSFRTGSEVPSMGAVLESAIVIQRPIDKVFGYVLDLEQSFRAFDPDVESVEKTPSGPIGAGTTFLLCQTVVGRRLCARVVYTAVELDRAIGFDASAGPLSTTATLTFQTENRGTSVHFRGDAGPTGPSNVLSPVIKIVIGRVWRNRLRRLKRILESDEAAT